MDGAPTPRDPFLRSRGMKIPKHPQITTGRVRGAIKGETYERKECDAVMRMVQDDDVVLELGGGIGYMSTLIATHKKASRDFLEYRRELEAVAAEYAARRATPDDRTMLGDVLGRMKTASPGDTVNPVSASQASRSSI